MIDISEQSANLPNNAGDRNKTKIVAAGGILAALAASTCCIIPLALFSLGVGGAWIGKLT
ncbi:MAG: mercury transporter MerT, partial [Candidatus Competibacteraceae bacterium]|nr:mercury transporter MerT [Candidatus Competibacteraceae bacterium]